MLHTEVHTVHCVQDVGLLETAGLPLINPDGAACETCGTQVGSTDNGFTALAVVLNDNDDWLLCMDCALPSVKPRG